MRKPDSAMAAASLADLQLAAAAAAETAQPCEASGAPMAASRMAVSIIYRKPAAADLSQPYTLPPRVVARRHAECLTGCVIGMRHKPT
jgi:hypothetical protein